jgi:hypothetical protein
MRDDKNEAFAEVITRESKYRLYKKLKRPTVKLIWHKIRVFILA